MSDTFPDAPRADADEKVRGTARFGADDARVGLLHGAFAVATIGKGRLRSLDVAAARSAPGVRLVLTHVEMDGIVSGGAAATGGYAFQSFQPMLSTTIAYRGQYVAFVVADTLENAIAGAERVRATYESVPHSATIEDPQAADIVEQADLPNPDPVTTDGAEGETDRAFQAAPVKIEAAYSSPPQHQNPIELIASVADWRDGVLTVHEGTQNSAAVRYGLARQLGIRPDQVRLISPYVGGAFGQKNTLQMQTVFAAVAARRLRRPVKVVVPRAQLFHNASLRPASRHRLRLGAAADGRMLALVHEIETQTSRHDLFAGSYAEVTSRLHGIDHFRSTTRLVRTDTQTPGFMRAPWEHIGSFALESAIDELAYAVNADPVALRLANDTTTDPITRKPLSSRHMAACLQRGAELFGWSGRTMAPSSMRADDGTLIGWGVASGAYKASTAPAMARLRVSDTGQVRAYVAGHEMGQGIRSAVMAILVEKLDVPASAIILEMGSSAGSTPQHHTAGSWGTATAVPTMANAADLLLAELARIAPAGVGGAPGDILRAAGQPFLEVEARRTAPGQPDAVFQRLANGFQAAIGPVYPEFVSFSYIAHYVEVRVEPTTRRIRVPRVVSVVDCGRVMNPRTARSQVLGGVVWGIGAALREESEVDDRFGGFLNANLADYVIPVNADIGAIDVAFIDEPDYRLNSVGVKGLGEVAMVGVAPAIANAVFHATGRRLRDLPFHIESLL